jgi:hypothetical protein
MLSMFVEILEFVAYADLLAIAVMLIVLININLYVKYALLSCSLFICINFKDEIGELNFIVSVLLCVSGILTLLIKEVVYAIARRRLIIK